MHTRFRLWLLALVPGVSSIGMAQSLSLSASAPVTLNASFGSVAQSSTLPAGPMPAVGGQSASAASFGGSTTVALDWHTDVRATELYCELAARCDASGFLTGQSTAPASDFLLALSAPTAMSVQILLEKEIAGVSWALVPVTRVDVGNDGSEELTEALTGDAAPVFVTLDPTPLLVRCRVGAQLNGPGSVLGKVRVRVMPRDIQVMPWITACGPELLSLLPRLDGGLQCVHSPLFTDPAVLVLGLEAQPLFLGSAMGLPCLLLPRPDLVTLIAPWTPFVLPIPAAVRPVQVYAQTVSLGVFGLTVSTGYRVHAY